MSWEGWDYDIEAMCVECSDLCRDLRIVFFVQIESRIDSAVYHARRNTAQRPYSLLQAYNMLTTSIVNVCDEREWCTDYGTLNWVLVYFNSVIKLVKQCCCTLILLLKSTLNANLTTTNRFFTNDNWQRGRFENFESDHQYESNLESDVRFEIESNHEASQVPRSLFCWYWLEALWELPDKSFSQSWMLQKYALGLTALSITRLSCVMYTGAQLVYWMTTKECWRHWAICLYVIGRKLTFWQQTYWSGKACDTLWNKTETKHWNSPKQF